MHLDWFRAEIVTPVTQLVFDPAEVEEILWLTLRELFDAPDTLASNSPFLTGILSDPVRRECLR